MNYRKKSNKKIYNNLIGGSSHIFSIYKTKKIMNESFESQMDPIDIIYGGNFYIKIPENLKNINDKKLISGELYFVNIGKLRRGHFPFKLSSLINQKSTKDVLLFIKKNGIQMKLQHNDGKLLQLGTLQCSVDKSCIFKIKPLFKPQSLKKMIKKFSNQKLMGNLPNFETKLKSKKKTNQKIKIKRKTKINKKKNQKKQEIGGDLIPTLYKEIDSLYEKINNYELDLVELNYAKDKLIKHKENLENSQSKIPKKLIEIIETIKEEIKDIQGWANLGLRSNE